MRKMVEKTKIVGSIFPAPGDPARPPEHPMVKDAVTCRRTTEEGKVRWSAVQGGAQCTQTLSDGSQADPERI